MPNSNGFPWIVIGGSAGGIVALQKLVADLPPHLDAAVFVVIHTAPYGHSFLPQVLINAGNLPAQYPGEQEHVRPGIIYVAPPNRHLEIDDGNAILTTGPKENRSRPAINPLFRTAALAHGPQVIGVVLSGLLDDGTAGLWEIKRRGGITIVQAPDDAAHDGMPKSALANVDVDYSVPMSEMGPLLVSLCYREART
jgi:two-component system, chemotaxis family, protein-glutamate methylesterase/glutaminase